MHFPRLSSAVFAAMLLIELPAFAANFSISTNSTTAQTLGSGSGQTGSISSGVSLTVGGSSVAVTISGNNATLNNDGTISQTGTGRAIRDNTGVTGLIINNGSSTNSAALMQTADADVIQMAKSPASVTLNNYGTMTSLNASAGGAQAVDFAAIMSGSNAVNNYATGTLQATEADAVRPGVNGFVYNDGTIKSTTSTGSSSDGVDVQNNSGVTIVNASAIMGDTTGTGLIEGARHGITGGALDNTVSFTMSVTNNVGGTIQGDNGAGINIDGFNANEVVTVVNHGTITGNGHDISDGKSHDGDGVDVDGLVNLTNTGTIKSINAFSVPADGIAYSEGLSVGGGTVTNSGLIEGDVAMGNTNAVGRGITFVGNDITTGPLMGTREAIYGDVTLVNQSGGVIRGQNDSAVVVGGPASGHTVSITNESGGLMEGGGATAAVVQTGADNDTVINAGTITNTGGNSKLAVSLGAGDDHLTFSGAAPSVTGGLDGGSGGETVGDILTVNLTGGSTLTLGGAITNFESIQVQSGSLTLGGQLSLALNGSTAGAPAGFGQLVFSAATGALVLDSGASLDIVLGFTPSFGETFDIINFTSGGTLSGTFAGLAEGATFTVGGQEFSITYQGGVSGHDVVLTAIPEPSTTVLLFAGLAGGATLVVRRRRASQV